MLSDEEKEIFKNLKEYMQNNINNGYHKFVYNDLDWDFKCIDCINAIDKVLKQSKEIEELKESLKCTQNSWYEDTKIKANLKSEYEKLIKEGNILFPLYKSEAKRLINLIEKQSKEIEELKVNNKKLKDRCKELIFEKQELTSALLDSTPNDKIKAKIEELKQEKSEYEDTPEWELFDYLEGQIEVLQSLLEKE